MPEMLVLGKVINSIYKSVIDRHIELPSNYGNSVLEYVAPSMSDYFKRTTYKKEKLSQTAIDTFIEKMENDSSINMSGFGMLVGGKLLAEHYPEYNTPCSRHISYSMAKSVVSMVFGIAVSQGLIAVSDKLVDIFPEHDGIFFKHGMKEVTMEHLLTMTAGVTFDELSAYFTEHWCTAYMGSELAFKPGSEFAYNSLNTYMLAAAVEKRSGIPFMEYADRYLFKPLCIYDITWDKCPDGRVLGGWGMKLSIQDMLKLGELYRRGGKWVTESGDTVTIIPEDWVKASTAIKHKIDDNKIISGYGYQIWVLRDGAFLFNGVFGQNVYVNPDREIVIAVTASAYALFPDSSLLEHIMRLADYAFDKVDDKKINKRQNKSFFGISQKIESYYRKKYASDNLYRLLRQYESQVLSGCVIHFKGYAPGILPVTTQVMYSVFSSGMSYMSLKTDFSYANTCPKLILCVCEDGEKYNIVLGGDCFEQQVIKIRGKEYKLSAGFKPHIRNGNQLWIYISLIYPEEISSKYFDIYVMGDHAYIETDETPDMARFLGIVIGNPMMLRTKNIKLEQLPDAILQKLNHIIKPAMTAVVKKHIEQEDN